MSAMIEVEPTAPALTQDQPPSSKGAQDLEAGEDEGTTLFLTDPTDLDIVSRVTTMQLPPCWLLGYKAKNPSSPDRAPRSLKKWRFWPPSTPTTTCRTSLPVW
jgi:hypothetical protein